MSADTSPLNNTCSPGMVDWSKRAPGDTSAEVCAGGVASWTFNHPCPIPKEDPSCGPVLVWTPTTTINSCAYETGTTSITRSGTLPSTLVQECSSGTLKPICKNVPVASETCATYAAAAATAAKNSAAYKGGQGGSVNYGAGITMSNPVQGGANNLTCTYTLNNVPTMTTGQNAGVCGETTTWSQQQSKTEPIWQTCLVDTAHACATLDKVTYLPAGDALKAGPDQGFFEKSSCLSTEDVPVPATDVPGGVTDSKFKTMQSNLATALADGFAGTDSSNVVTVDSTIAQQLVQEMKLLFEFDGDKMTADDQAAAVALYAQYPDTADTPSCGANFVPPSIPSCTVDPTVIKRLNAEMEFCSRMTSPAVNPSIRQIPAVYDTCIEKVASDIGALRASLLANGADNGSANPVVAAIDAGGGPGVDAGDGGITEAGAGSEGGSTDAASGDGGAGDPNDICGFKSYRAQFDTFVTTPLEGRMEVSQDPTSSAGSTELATRLKLIDRWYNALAANLWPFNPTTEGTANAASVQGVAWSHAQGMEQVFFQNVYQNLFAAAAVTVSDAGGLTLGPDASLPDGAAPPVLALDAKTLAGLTQDTLKADRALLGILFPYDATLPTQATPPLQSAPLVLLLGDAFEGMSQRMQSVGVYHDMGCAYLGCGPATQTELVWLTELLASTPDASNTGVAANVGNLWKLDLHDVLSLAHLAKDANNNNIVGPEWLSVYDGMSFQHAALENAVQSMMGTAPGSYYTTGLPVLTSGTTNGLPAPARHFAGVIQGARVAAETYLTTGLFNPTARNQLPAGIAQDNVDAIRSNISREALALGGAAKDFDSNLVTMANAVVQEMNSTMTMTNSLDSIREKGATFDQLADNIDGLRASLVANESELSQYIANYSSLTATDDNGPITGPSYGPWAFDGTSAKAYGPVVPMGDISTVAAQKITDGRLTPGTIVNVQVSQGDRWSPTCAINAAKYLASVASPTPVAINSAGALAGPEGFLATISGSSASLSANQTSTNTANNSTTDYEAKVCAGIHAQAGVGVPSQPTEVYGYVDVSACLDQSQTSTDSTTTADSTTTSTTFSGSMSFASGLRMPNTPFPNAPVGALLAVITNHGDPMSWKDVRVIEAPSTALLMDGNSDVYFVSNDIGCTGADTTHQLSVSVTTAQHAGQVLGWVPNGLAAVGTYLDGLAAGDPTASSANIPAGSVIAQGTMTPDQAAEIKSTALTKLTAACNAIQGGANGAGSGAPSNNPACDPSKLPTSVGEFVNNYIDREVEAIELKLEILQTSRTMASTGFELQEMVDDYDSSQSQANVASLIPQWLLRNLDTALLQDETAQLVNEVTYELYPLIQLRYPDLLASGLAQDQTLTSDLQTLVNAPWDSQVDTLAAKAADAATELYNLTENLSPWAPAVETRPVALDFVRPGYKAPAAPAPQTFYPTVADGRALEVWTQATTGNHVATFTVNPEDLYQYAGGPASLVCTQEAPVMLDFAVYLSGTNVVQRLVNLYSGPVTARSFTGSKLRFPIADTYDKNGALFAPGGDMEFDLSNLEWASLDTPIYANADVSAALYTTAATSPVNAFSSRSDTTKYANGRGLSPFTDITIDFSSLYDTTKTPTADNPLLVSDHITLIFNLQYRKVAPNQSMSWLAPNCVPPAQ